MVQDSIATMEKRGGAHHRPKPRVDDVVLQTIFEKHKDILMNLGVYEHISKPMAASGEGLAYCYDLLSDLLEACPSSGVPTGIAKSAIMKLLMAEPTLNGTIYNAQIFAGMRVDRLGVVLLHLRRICQDDVRQRQCGAKCNGKAWQLVQQLIPKVNMEWCFLEDSATIYYDPVNPKSSRTLTRELSVDSDGFPRLLTAKTSSPTEKRQLKRELSVDEHGFPNMLSALAPAKKSKGPEVANQSQASSSWEQPQSSLRAKLGMNPIAKPNPPKAKQAQVKSQDQDIQATMLVSPECFKCIKAADQFGPYISCFTFCNTACMHVSTQ